MSIISCNNNEATLLCGDNGCKDVTTYGCICIGEGCDINVQQMSINTIENIPSNNKVINNNNNNHYPIFLPTAIIICISFGILCLIAFFIYYKYFTKQENKTNLLNEDGYNTFASNKALEMENYTNNKYSNVI